jgi:hypothetical protein
VNRLVVAVAAMLLLSGCARTRVYVHERDVRPSTYEPRQGSTLQRTTGRLRRVALVVVPFAASPDEARWCMERCDIESEQRRIAERVLELLRDWRGYDVIAVDVGPAPAAAESLTALGRRLGVDGIFVLRGNAVYLTWVDGLLWFATLTFAIPISMARIGTRVELNLYETRRGNLVWRTMASVGGSPEVAPNVGDALVNPLELAWPLALTAPPPARALPD